LRANAACAFRPIRDPSRDPSIVPTIFRSPKWACRPISLKEGSDYIGHDKAWGEKKFQEYNQAHYHQPSDEYRDDWNFQGMIQEADFAMEIGRRVANLPALPKFNPNDEFARKQ
jgi:hypothetical protein